RSQSYPPLGAITFRSSPVQVAARTAPFSYLRVDIKVRSSGRLLPLPPQQAANHRAGDTCMRTSTSAPRPLALKIRQCAASATPKTLNEGRGSTLLLGAAENSAGRLCNKPL